jgi:hypothetical protein
MLGGRKVTTLGGDVFRDEYSLAFDGTDDYLDLGASNSLITGNNVTMAAWVKLADTDRGYIMGNARASGSSNLSISVNADGASVSAGFITVIVYSGSSANFVTYDGNINDNKWHHIAFTTTASAQVLYLDGVAVATGSNTFSNSASTDSMLIGNLIGGSLYFGGNISEAVLYNSTLSASQVKTLYNGREPYNHKEGIASSNLKGWWRMGDGRFDKNHAPDPEEGLIGNEVSIGLGSDLLGGKGDMSDSSYWTVSGDASDKIVFADGVCKFTASDNGTDNMVLNKASLLTVGKVYRVDVDITAIEDPATILAIDNNPEYITFTSTGDTAVGRYTAIYRSTQTTFKLYRWKTGQDTEDYLYVDNLVIREVTGDSHGIIQSIPTFTGDTP